jgi:hypothetical protein
VNQGSVGGGKGMTLSKNEMYMVRIRMEGMDSPVIPEDFEESAFDMEGNSIQDKDEESEEKLIVPFSVETPIPTFNLIKDTLNNLVSLPDRDVSDSESLVSPLKSLVESQDDVTPKGKI